MANRKGRGSAYKLLLDDKEVKRWYDNVARGSVVTADVYLRRLGNFCESHKLTPMKLAAKSEKQIYGILLDYITELEKRDLSGSYIASILKAIKSWLSHNDKEIKKKLKVKDSGIHPTLKDERVPTPQELKSILLSGDKKTRVACSLLAHSGLRIQTLGNYTGDDGLVVGDFPEMEVEGDSVVFETVPARVVVFLIPLGRGLRVPEGLPRGEVAQWGEAEEGFSNTHAQNCQKTFHIDHQSLTCNKRSHKECWVSMATLRVTILFRHAADACGIERLRPTRLPDILDGARGRY
jgi:hypothetical protein